MSKVLYWDSALGAQFERDATPDEEAEIQARRSAPLDRAAAAAQVDEAVAAVYGRFTRFALEYEEREAQAHAFKNGGYAGALPARVAEFATPAGKGAQEATDLILAQAAQLRSAQGQLSALRMRKYEVLRAPTDAAAREALTAILAGVDAVAKAVA